MSPQRSLIGLIALATIAGATGCSDKPAAAPGPTGSAAAPAAVPASAPAWKEPPVYGFVLDSSCGERNLTGRFRVSVGNGRVTRLEGLDEAGKKAAETTESELVPTLGQLLEIAQTARDDGADLVQADVDPADGHPSKLQIDPDSTVDADESCYVVSEYAVG